MCNLEILVSLLLIIIFTFILHVKRRRRHPPGQLGLPFVGILPYRIIEIFLSPWRAIRSDATKFKESKASYGPIWSIEIGRQRFVTLASKELIMETLVDNAELFSGRSHNSVFRIISGGRGIVLNDGEMWRAHRQLAIKSLKDLGMGKNELEIRICHEADVMISFLTELCSEPVNFVNILNKGLANVMSSLVFCQSNDYNDPHFECYITKLRSVLHSDVANKIISLSPYIFQTRIIRNLIPKVNQFLSANEYCRNFIIQKCLVRAQLIINDSLPNCVFDFFQKNRFSESSTVSINEQKEEITQSMFDLFNAGIDTTSNLLSFAFLFLGKDQELQSDLRNEIKELVEDGRHINGDMRKFCPKYLSFIDEVQRYCSIIPKAHHRVLKNFKFHDYDLYSDDIIFADILSVHYDPDLFKDPQQFYAYRFTDFSRTKYCPNKSLMPFGVGKRSCLGERIAMIESFIFLEKVIQKFNITLTEETLKNIDSIIEGHSGLIHAPLDHHIRLTPHY